MRHRTTSTVAMLALLVGAFIASSPAAQAAPTGETRPVRIAGEDRLRTAVALSAAGWPTAETVLVARTDDPADALAGSSLAGRLDAPLLITPTSSLPDVVGDEVRRLGATRAIILGGPNAVAPQVEADLRAAGVSTVDRIAGATRYGTAAAIAEQLGETSGHTALVVGGWPDALGVAGLAAGRAAAGDAWPIFLVSGTVPEETLAGLRAMDPSEVIVAGGPAAVSEQVFNALDDEFEGVRRVAGDDRYETSLRFAQLRPGEGPLVVATGANFPDGLAAGPYTAAIRGTLLLVPPKQLPTAHLAWLMPGGVADELRIVGGRNAVPTLIEMGVWSALVRLGSLPAPSPVGAIRIGTNQVPQVVVDAHPAGTTFVFAAGVHRGATVTPRAGDRFVGEDGAVLSGALPLPAAAWTASGGDWYVDGQTQQGDRDGELDTGGNPRHRYPEELFVGGHRWEHVGSRDALTDGTWFFDYAADRIWLGVDPAGLGSIETSVTPVAFEGTDPGTDGVTIANLTIDAYASPTRLGAINAPIGADWVIQRVTVSRSHGVGIFVGPGARIERSAVLDSGQLGVRIRGTFGYGPRKGQSLPITIASNRISGNGVLDFRWSWEAGGVKGFDVPAGLAFVNNLVADNGGTGIWADAGTADAAVVGNRSADNGWRGALIELTERADLVWNEFLDNGKTDDIFREAGVYVSNSHDVEVRRNLLAGNTSGLLARSAADRDLVMTNMDIHHNDIHVVAGRTGMFIDNGETTAAYTSRGNRFHANTHRVPDRDGLHWIWTNDRAGDWDAWQSAGMDLGGMVLETGSRGTLEDGAVGYAAVPYGAG